MGDSSQEVESGNDFSKLKVVDLKRMLKTKGLSTTGNKQELIERLQQSDTAFEELLEGGGAGEEEGFDEELEDIDEAALMKDDKEEETKEAEEKLEEETKVEEGEGEPLSKKKKLSINRSSAESAAAEAKSTEAEGESGEGKVDSSTADPAPGEPEGGGPAGEAAAGGANGEVEGADSGATPDPDSGKPSSSDSTPDEKKMIRIKDMGSLIDDKNKKLSLRAQKFGLSESAKKELRAARFGIPTKTTVADRDVLKKRAERFGSSGDSAKEKTELEKKLQMRKERFSTGGSAQEEAKPVPATASASSLEEKKALRAQRFKVATTS